jgi:hypothetical protein
MPAPLQNSVFEGDVALLKSESQRSTSCPVRQARSSIRLGPKQPLGLRIILKLVWCAFLGLLGYHLFFKDR